MNLQYYQSLVFDCDGVILNSNHVKTNAFYQAAISYGESAAKTLVDYHIQNGGISRYRKFEYFLEHIVRQESDQKDLDFLLKRYSEITWEGLLRSEITQDLLELKSNSENIRWHIVSGSDQRELRKLFEARNLTDFFDGGIFGSPHTKEEILLREIKVGNIQLPAVFIGDSRYDYDAARQSGLEFIFVSGWTEMRNYRDFVKMAEIKCIEKVCDLKMLLADKVNKTAKDI
jgi:HAD superfamily hydrolase (TIGR01549 family)